MGFILFLVTGAGMFFAGIYYLVKEKEDKRAAKAYKIVSFIGVCLVAAAFSVKFLA